MSAGTALQSSIVSALAANTELTGVFDGPPARAAYPYVVADAGRESDWSHKSAAGREVLLALTIWDEQPERLQRLADETERQMLSVTATGNWSLVTMQFLRRRTVRDVAGPWAIALDFRARLLENNQELSEWVQSEEVPFC